MKVFLTGGSGFIGGHAIEALARRGEVRALARSDAAAAQVRQRGAVVVPGDLASLGPEPLRGCDVVVHAAARAEEWGTREQFWSANVEGTRRALEAAKGAGVRRFVHIGTEAALFDGHDLVDIDETAPYPARQRYPYSETKAEAERLVLAANAPGFETISLRPRLVWGPRDATVLPAIVRMAKEGSFAWLDGGVAKTSTTHVANLVRAIELALAGGVPGHAYFVADDGTRTVRDFLTSLARTLGVELGARNVPSFVARPIARVVEAAWRLFRVRRQPPMTRFAVDMMSSTVTVRTDRARRELGYAPVISVDDGLAAMRAAP
jgi:hypothetical protein